LSTSLVSVLEYLVIKIMAGRDEVVRSLYEYLVNGGSPSVISEKYKLSKHQIRGYAQRVIERAGSVSRAKAILRYSYPYIFKIKPAVKPINDSLVKCLLCGDEIPMLIIEDHIKRQHEDVVREYVDAVIDLLLREFSKTKR